MSKLLNAPNSCYSLIVPYLSMFSTKFVWSPFLSNLILSKLAVNKSVTSGVRNSIYRYKIMLLLLMYYVIVWDIVKNVVVKTTITTAGHEIF